jgi:hypothetical protein
VWVCRGDPSAGCNCIEWSVAKGQANFKTEITPSQNSPASSSKSGKVPQFLLCGVSIRRRDRFLLCNNWHLVKQPGQLLPSHLTFNMCSQCRTISTSSASSSHVKGAPSLSSSMGSFRFIQVSAYFFPGLKLRVDEG